MQAKRTLIQDHLDHCLDDAVVGMPRDLRWSIDECREIENFL